MQEEHPDWTVQLRMSSSTSATVAGGKTLKSESVAGWGG